MTAHADGHTLERLVDRQQIEDQMYRWCRAVDRLDLEAIRSVFHADAIDNHNAYVGGVDGLLAWIGERHKTIPFSMHLVANMLIEFASRDVALVESYLWAVQRYPENAKASLGQLSGGATGKEGSGVDMLACARYVDRFERRDGEWRIARRNVMADQKMLIDAPADGPRMLDTWNIGRRDRQDLVYRERAELGLEG